MLASVGKKWWGYAKNREHKSTEELVNVQR